MPNYKLLPYDKYESAPIYNGTCIEAYPYELQKYLLDPKTEQDCVNMLNKNNIKFNTVKPYLATSVSKQCPGKIQYNIVCKTDQTSEAKEAQNLKEEFSNLRYNKKNNNSFTMCKCLMMTIIVFLLYKYFKKTKKM